MANRARQGLLPVLLVAFIVAMAVSPATAEASPEHYGPGIAADELNNTIVGGPWRQKVSYRFRARTTSRLKSIRVYVINHKSGYASGTGGTWRITVRRDDGTKNHFPSAGVLAKRIVTQPQRDAGARYNFADPPSLKKGLLYHVVFENIDPEPTANYSSLDTLHVFNKLKTWQPAFSNSSWAELTKTAGGAWSAYRGPGNGTNTPIMALRYANGVQHGVGYMEVWQHSARDISGPLKVGEVFTVTGKDRIISTVTVRLKRVTGSSSLRIRLVNGSGKVLAKGALPAARFPISARSAPGGSVWAKLGFGKDVRLKAGKRYRLVLSGDDATIYSAFVIREGTSYGYGRRTQFTDGHAQFDNGSGWQPFTGWGRPSTEGDLQFYFR